MVSQPPERRDFPGYALDHVKSLAEKGKIQYASRRVQLDVANLEYGFDDVCDCIAALQAKHFVHSERYGDDTRWYDVYQIHWRRPTGPPDSLYVKFRLGRNCIVIDLCSFHRPR